GETKDERRLDGWHAEMVSQRGGAATSDDGVASNPLAGVARRRSHCCVAGCRTDLAIPSLAHFGLAGVRRSTTNGHAGFARSGSARSAANNHGGPAHLPDDLVRPVAPIRVARHVVG